MTARKGLRAVVPGEEAPPKPKPADLLEAVAAGDYLAELRFTHVRIAKTVAAEGTSPRDLAALTRRQHEISKEIRALELAAKQEADGDADAAPDEELDASAF
jgi:hypothetical protein